MAAFELHISGLAGPLCVVHAGEDWQLLDLQKAVADSAAIPVDQQRLIFGATILAGTNQLLAKLLPTGVNEILCVRSKQWLEIPYLTGSPGSHVFDRTGHLPNCKSIDEAKIVCHENDDLWGFTYRLASIGSIEELHFRGDGFELGFNNKTGTTLVKLTPAGRAVLLKALRATKGRKAELIQAISDLDTILAAVEENPVVFRHACDDLRCNTQVAEVAVMKNPFALQHAPDSVKDDPEIVRRAIEINAFALQHASDHLKTDRDIVLHAIDREPSTIRYASHALRADPDVGLVAIRRDGKILQHLHDDLRDNHSIVMAAVEQYGQALCFASRRLRADAEVVAAAIKQDSSAAEFAL